MLPPRASIRDGLGLLRTLGGRTASLPPASLFPDGEDMVRWSAMGRTFVVSRSPEHVERVFVGGYDRFQKATHYRLLATVTGEGLLTSEGEAWERQRRLIQPVLGRRQIDGLVPPMVEATRRRSSSSWTTLRVEPKSSAAGSTTAPQYRYGK